MLIWRHKGRDNVLEPRCWGHLVKAGALVFLSGRNRDHGWRGMPIGAGATKEVRRERKRDRQADRQTPLAFPSSTNRSQRAREPGEQPGSKQKPISLIRQGFLEDAVA